MIANAESRNRISPSDPYYGTRSEALRPNPSAGPGARHQDQRAEVVQVGARPGAAGPPVLVVEAPEVPLPLLLAVQVADGEVEPEPRLPHRRAPERPGPHFQAGIGADLPLDDVALSARERL